MRNLLFSATLALCATGTASAELFGVASFAPFASQSLYRIDPATGAATVIGNTGLDEINDIAWSQADATLYAYTSRADLYRIDITTGAATLIAARTDTVPEGSLTVSPAGMLFSTDGLELVRVDPLTAALTTVGAIGPDALDISGLAFGPGQTLYGYDKNGTGDDYLVTLDRTTGLATRVGQTGTTDAGNVGGLTYDPTTALLYLTDGSRLYTVNTITGAATPIGAHGVGGMSGLAYVPEPTTLMLLVVVAGLIRRR